MFEYEYADDGKIVILVFAKKENAIIPTSILDELDIPYNIEYKSKYNNYVIYEYEPCCVEGFNYRIKIAYTDDNIANSHLDFALYLINIIKLQIDKFERSFKENGQICTRLIDNDSSDLL